MIFNIIDRRRRKHRWRYVYAIVEPTWHDNECRDSDHISSTMYRDTEIDYDERVHISLHDAIIWAERLPFAATLYIYDDGVENVEISFDADGKREVRLAEARTN